MEINEILGDELFNQVKQKLGDKKLIVNDGTYIPITKFNEINEKNKVLSQQVESFGNTSKEPEKLLETHKDLSGKYQELQTKYQKDLELKNKELENVTKKSALLDILGTNKAIYPSLLLKEIDLDYVKIENGSLIGFNVEDLKTKFPSMFQQQKASGTTLGDEGKPPIAKGKRDDLIEQYNNAEKQRNVGLMMKLQRQIRELPKE
jgi:hypothetical protein